ncbi:MAG TPA: glycosyltransferase [Bryobacteraceae bacterium]|jgi:glycosyltransferase involved in cell wall biosynthesis|nr:glycosyltransferase [Bryobacteraceae bacterium]
MTPQPLVSFVVPCYNYGRYLPDCLSAIFGQEGDYRFEVIAIDDASSDNTQEVLEQFRDPRMRVIVHEKNEGHVRTISQGLLEARGKYVSRIDPDDRHRPWFLKEAVSRLERHPEVGFVYGDAALIGPGGQIYEETSDRMHEGRDYKGNELIPLLLNNFVCAPTTMARREAWVETLPVPANFAFSDWFFNIMIARRYEFCYVARVLADYRVHDSNLHTQVVRDKSEEPSIRRLLDRVFSEREEDPELERKKQAVRRKVYSHQYLTLANKYFGAGLRQDSRRCYFTALRYSPGEALSFTALRRLAATYMEPEIYSKAKRVLGRA